MVVAIAAVITIVVVVIGGYVKGQFKETCTAIDGQGVTNANPSGGTCNS
jgi:Flp pilus assembly pilin Flp